MSDANPTNTAAASSANDKDSLRILLILSALMASASISIDMYLPAMPELSRAFHTGDSAIQLTLTGYLVGFSFGQLLWGPIGDRRGRRGPLFIAFILFMISAIGCAMSETAWQMIVWRAVQGAGACAGPVLARAIVRDLYPRERSAQVLSTLILVMGVSPLVGPVVGGQILKIGSWQYIFILQALLGLGVFVGVCLLKESLPKEKRVKQGIDVVLRSYRDLLRQPQFMGYTLASSFFYGGVYAYLAGTPFAYIEYYHASTFEYGLLFGINMLGMMGANFLNAKLLKRYSSDRLLIVGASGLALSGIVVLLTATSGWLGLAGLAIPFFFFLSLNGLVVANATAGAMEPFPRMAGVASALIGAVNYWTGMFSTAAMGWLSNGTPVAMGWIVGFCGLCSLAATLLTVKQGKKMKVLALKVARNNK